MATPAASSIGFVTMDAVTWKLERLLLGKRRGTVTVRSSRANTYSPLTYDPLLLQVYRSNYY